MLELIVAGAVGAVGHLKSRDFVHRRLRFTRVAEMPGVGGVVAGVGTTLALGPVVALLPVVGAGTAIVAGLGVGTGVAVGALRARKGSYESRGDD